MKREISKSFKMIDAKAKQVLTERVESIIKNINNPLEEFYYIFSLCSDKKLFYSQIAKSFESYFLNRDWKYFTYHLYKNIIWKDFTSWYIAAHLNDEIVRYFNDNERKLNDVDYLKSELDSKSRTILQLQEDKHKLLEKLNSNTSKQNKSFYSLISKIWK